FLLVVGEQPLRLLAQAARLVELPADVVGPRIERLGEQGRHAVIDEDAQEDDEGDRDPELGQRCHRCPSYSPAPSASARLTCSRVTSLPSNLATIAPARSAAISPTPAKALRLVSSMRASASASLWPISLSIVARSRSTSSARLSRMPRAIVCALARA